MSENAPVDNKVDKVEEGSYPETYEDIPYESIVEALDEWMIGEDEYRDW